MNEARLFSVETRINEEEEMRIREYEYVRDLLKKLLYSLEQLNMSQIDNKGLANVALNTSSEAGQLEGKVESKLPTLLVAGNEATRQSFQAQANTTG